MKWVASDTASWIFFGLGVLSAALAIVGTVFPVSPNRFPVRRIRLFLGYLSVWSPTVVGPLLLLGGVVLVGMGAGRLSWLSIFSGAVCLFVFAYLLLFTKINEILRGQEEVAPFLHRQADIDSSSRRWEEDTLPNLFENGRLPNYLLTWNPDSVPDPEPRYLRGPDPVPDKETLTFEDFASSMVGTGHWAPVSIYTAADDGTGLKAAVRAVLREFGLESTVEEPPVQGSWFQRFWARSREVAESKPVRQRLAKLERAVELEQLGKRQADIDKAKAESVAALYTVVKEQKNAVVRMGSIIMIKAEDDLVVWTVGELEAAALEKHSELLRDPVAALKFLRGGSSSKQIHEPTSGTSVTMPALGESVTEGTVTRWLKQVGDQVDEDEPLLEVSTDKVDAEIPSPVAGTLLAITAAEDSTVEVGGQLAVIGGKNPRASEPSGRDAPSADEGRRP